MPDPDKKNAPPAIAWPPNKTQAEVLAAIERVVGILAPSFAFGFYDVEDIKQEGRMAAMKKLYKYDPTRPLENFLYAVVRSRLINFKRDKFKRSDPPCKECHAGLPCPTCSGDGPCKKYKVWLRLNTTKAALVQTLDLDNISDEKERHTRSESEALDTVVGEELLERIDRDLPVELRSYYLQMRAGVAIPKAKKHEVVEAVRRILAGDGD